MSADLPPDVRDRAAAELCRLYLAKTLTLPAGLPGIQFHEITEDGRDVYRELVDAVAEVLAAEQPKWMHANIADCAETEREVMRLQARVDLLTAALTEIVVIVNHSSLSMSSTTTDLLLRSVNRACAVLSATPTDVES